MNWMTSLAVACLLLFGIGCSDAVTDDGDASGQPPDVSSDAAAQAG